MPMLVVSVRIVLMSVGQGFVTVPVRMTCSRSYGEFVTMLMVFVVNMLHRLMRMFMPVVFRQVEQIPNAINAPAMSSRLVGCSRRNKTDRMAPKKGATE